MRKTSLSYRVMNALNKFGDDRRKTVEVMGVNVNSLISYGIPLIRKSG